MALGTSLRTGAATRGLGFPFRAGSWEQRSVTIQGSPGAPHTQLPRQSGSKPQRRFRRAAGRRTAGWHTSPCPREQGDPLLPPAGGVVRASLRSWQEKGHSLDRVKPRSAPSPGHVGPSEPWKPTRCWRCVSESLQMFRAQALIRNLFFFWKSFCTKLRNNQNMSVICWFQNQGDCMGRAAPHVPSTLSEPGRP